MHLFNLESHRDYLKKTRVKCKYKELKDEALRAEVTLGSQDRKVITDVNYRAWETIIHILVNNISGVMF